MPENSLTDATYELIEQVEGKTNKINITIMKYFFITALGLSINIIAYLSYVHGKGVSTDISMSLMNLLAASLHSTNDLRYKEICRALESEVSVAAI